MSQVQLAAVLSAVHCARRHVVAVLRQWGVDNDAVDTAELIVAELVTNAVRAVGFVDEALYRPWLRDQWHLLRVRLRLIGPSVYVEVTDSSPERPVLQEPQPEHVDGRGLVLVDRLSRQWGYFFLPTGGKVVWAEVEVQPLSSSAYWPGD